MKNIPLPDLYYLENPDLKQLFRIMRISIFLLFFCLFSLMAENSHSQNARVTINRSDALFFCHNLNFKLFCETVCAANVWRGLTK